MPGVRRPAEQRHAEDEAAMRKRQATVPTRMPSAWRQRSYYWADVEESRRRNRERHRRRALEKPEEVRAYFREYGRRQRAEKKADEHST